MNQISIILTKEEVRIIHQALNEVCNGIYFKDSEFETRMGAEKQAARVLLNKLKEVYEEN